MNLIVDIVSATENRAKPTASSPQTVPGNNTRTALRGGGGGRARDIGPVLRVWASALRNVSHCSQEQLQQSTPFLKKEDCGTTAV